jgi:glyoxylase-like metal-dependent hydrolase (beta-lactamase superfamily II)
MDFCRLFSGIDYVEYGFEGGPYLGFPVSHDVYGDGSMVVVPAFGHTPGSVIIFVTLPNGTRYAFVGDVVCGSWKESLSARSARGSHAEGAIQTPRPTAKTCCVWSHSKSACPELIIVPAHDMRAVAKLPRLTRPSSQNPH